MSYWTHVYTVCNTNCVYLKMLQELNQVTYILKCELKLWDIFIYQSDEVKGWKNLLLVRIYINKYFQVLLVRL